MLFVNGFHGISSAEAVLFWRDLKFIWDILDFDFTFFSPQENISSNDLNKREHFICSSSRLYFEVQLKSGDKLFTNSLKLSCQLVGKLSTNLRL